MDKTQPHLYTRLMANFYNQTVKETLGQFAVNPDKGLTTREVHKRQEVYGKNLLKFKETPLWRKLLEPFIVDGLRRGKAENILQIPYR